VKILGFLGSPRAKGRCSQLLQKALDGAASTGADTKRFDLINCDIQYCRGCCTCFEKNPELTIGTCPLNDDVASILEEYLQADGYIFASPAYDLNVTALMKTFLERKIAFTFKEDPDSIPVARPGIAVNFQKKASFIVTGNAPDDCEEVMGAPCYEAFESTLMFEEIDTQDRLFVGGMAAITAEAFSAKMEQSYQMGVNLVTAINAVRKTG